ncbi:heparin lyase I family protein [Rhizobium mesoamericanum]|uniref:heparin lyase I family protein n=1 Tax=Rhizobium mesoamericanum TaxID=1079800 RepID=UPI0006887CE8|nr:heparin lyase I family protein [Rhizobium mesoamericanum]
MKRQIWLTATLLAACTTSAQTIRDDFEANRLDPSKWTTAQIKLEQLHRVIPGRCTRQAIEVVTEPNDRGDDCPKEEPICQRAEVRSAKHYWPPFGEEVWFAFSFRILGDIPKVGSSRTVIGQWKAPKDDSPFLAQRFDNGVFHITVEDNGVRRVVALADGDPDKVLSVQRRLGNAQKPGQVAQMLREIKTLLEGKQTKPSAEVARDLGVAPSKLATTLQPIAFVAEPEKYVGKADIYVATPPEPKLPDPSKDWVDMVYRIKPGRTDNEIGPRRQGEIDIWANGDLVASVRGNLGVQLKAGDGPELAGPYFKFGTYRKFVPGTFRFQFDGFVQSSKPLLRRLPCDLR